jgi:hypothetical protein
MDEEEIAGRLVRHWPVEKASCFVDSGIGCRSFHSVAAGYLICPCLQAAENGGNRVVEQLRDTDRSWMKWAMGNGLRAWAKCLC